MINRALEVATQLRQYGDVKKSAALLNGVLKKHPNDTRANADMAVLAFMHHDFLEAKRYAEKAFDDTGENILNYSLYMYSLLKLGEFEKLKWIVNTTSPANIISGVFSCIKNPSMQQDNDSTEIDLNNLKDLITTLNSEGACEAILKFLNEHGYHENAVSTLAGLLTRLDRKIQAIFCFLIVKHFNPTSAGAHYNLAVLFYYKGEYSLALHEYQKCLQYEPNNKLALNNIASTFKRLNNPEAAIVNWKRCIALDPDSEQARVNLVNTLIELRKYDRADEELKEFELQSPNSPMYFRAAARFYKSQRKLVEAKIYSEKYLLSKPDDTNALLLSGAIQEDAGELQAAMENYAKVAFSAPINFPAITNLLQLAIQLQNANTIDTIKQKFSDSILQVPKILVLLTIHEYVSGNTLAAHSTFSILDKLLKNTLTASLDSEFNQFTGPYYKFLSELLKFNVSEPKINQEPIYVIGDSHSLTFACAELITTDALHLDCKSKIIFGTKMFHFAQKEHNRYQAIFRDAVSRLPSEAKVLLTFGEIDCRSNDGFVKNYNQDYDTMIENVANVIEEALKFVAEVKGENNVRFAFLSVPAPVPHESDLNSSSVSVSVLIKKFNEILREKCEVFSFGFVDCYQYTSGDGGWSNQTYHIDSHHLSPDIVKKLNSEIINQLKIT